MRKRLFDVKKKSIDENISESLSNIDLAYMQIGDLKKAEAFTNEGLKMQLTLYKNSDNKYLATSLNNFGVVLLLKGEDLNQAELYFNRSLALRLRLNNGNTSHPDVIESMDNCQFLNNLKQKKNLRNANKKKCQIL